jgi:Sulfotransferase family
MVWQPPPRPEWVRAVNAGTILPIADVASLPLERKALLDEARAELGIDGRGVDGFGDDAFLEPLRVLLPALEGEAELTILGRWITRRFIVRLLTVRAQTVAYVHQDPGVRDEIVEAPVFVTGAPRTGTTILHALLAQDPAARVPEGWELLRPVPPPDPTSFPDDARVVLADRELRMPALVTGTLDAIHEYRGRMHKECVSAMSFEFLSEEFTARYHVPSYVHWLASCDMTAAYEWHRLVLQVLQRRSRNVHWVLKSPVHLHSLPVLLAVYPDANLVVTHRDPLAVLPSVTSLVATMRWTHSDHVDFADIGRYHADLYSRSLDRLVDLTESGALDGVNVHHTHYRAFMADPIGTVGAVAKAMGTPLTADTESAMRAYLDAHPQGEHGEHRYSFEDLGADPVDVRARFARYQACFDVQNEV